MSFVRINGAGWASNDPLTADQINALDIDHANAVDGAGGGTYAPSAQIEIGGAGLKLLSTGAFRVDCLADFHGSMQLGDNSGDAILVNGILTCAASATFTSTLQVDGNVTLGNALTDTVLVAGILTVNDDLVVNGDVALGSASSDSIDQNGILTSHAPITLSTNSGIRWRIATGTDASQTYHPANYDIVYVPASTLSVGRTYTLGSTGALEGMRMLIITRDSGQVLTVDIGSGTFSLKYLSGQIMAYAFYYRSGAWVPGEVHPFP